MENDESVNYKHSAMHELLGHSKKSLHVENPASTFDFDAQWWSSNRSFFMFLQLLIEKIINMNPLQFYVCFSPGFGSGDDLFGDLEILQT